MPSEPLGKRSRESREVTELKVLEWLQPPVKAPKNESTDSPEQIRVKTALAHIATRLQDKETRDLLADSLQVQPHISSEIFAFQETLQKAIDNANNAAPISFDDVAEGVLYQLNLENYELRGDAAEMEQGWATRSSIIEDVRARILSKVNSGSSFETKLSALSTVTTVISAIIGIESRGEFARALQSEKLATAVTAELVKLGKMLSDSDIERIRTDNELVTAKLEAAKTFKVRQSGGKPWVGLGELLTLLERKI